LISKIPDEALLAASQSNDPRALAHWLCLAKRHEQDCLPTAQLAKAGGLPSRLYWQRLEIPLINHGGRQLVHNQGLDTYMTTTRLNDGKALPVNINTEQQLKLTLYPQLAVTEQWPQSSWLIVTTNMQQRRYLMSEINDSINLTLANDPLRKLAGLKTMVLDLRTGERVTEIEVQGHDALLMLHQYSELLPQLSGCQYNGKSFATYVNTSPWLNNNTVLQFDQHLVTSKDEPSQAEQQGSCSDDKTERYETVRSSHNSQRLTASPFLAGANITITTAKLHAQLNKVLAMHHEYIDNNKTGQLLLTALWLKQQQQLPPKIVAAINGLRPTQRQQLNWLSLINKGYSWQSLQGVSSSAGEQIFKYNTWRGLSPYLRLQEALLLQDTRPGERLMSNSRLDVIRLDTIVKQSLQLELRQVSRLGSLEKPAQFSVELDGQRSLITLQPGQSYSQAFVLSPGLHQLRISLANPQAHRQRPWVFFALNEANNNNETQRLTQSKLPLMRDRYLVASPQKPLVLQIPEFSWLRIDERDKSGKQHSTMRYFGAGQAQALQLTAKISKGPRYFKFYHWQETQSQEVQAAIPVALAGDESKQQVEHQVIHHRWPISASRSYQMLDIYPSAQQYDGSWGVFAGYRARRNFDEDEQTSQERFYQLGWRYQLKLADWRSYLKNELSVRKHERGGLKTLVSENRGLWQFSKFWQFGATLNGYYQLDANQPNVDGAWSGYASLNVDWRQYWHDNLNNKVTLTAFTRALSLRKGEFFAQQETDEHIENGQAVDDDVFSNYKADHRFGLRLSDTLRYTPWLDTELRLKAAVTSDINGNFTNPHKLSLAIGFRQYWQPLTGKVDLQRSRYFRDKTDLDSNGPLDRSTLRFGLIWDRWSRKGQLWQIETSVNRDLNGGGTNFFIQLHWGQTQGKGFDDFLPNTLNFGTLRKRDSHYGIKTNQVVRNGHE
jgi:hypothetical protein